MCPVPRDRRRDERTICTAVAPEPVFTVRAYADTTLPKTGLSVTCQKNRCCPHQKVPDAEPRPARSP
jgi:hypothetical protein